VSDVVVVAWWVFWLTLGIAVFCGLIWAFYRLAVSSDEARWRDFLNARAARDAADRETGDRSPAH
jgi:hypothetical protein